MARAVRAHAVPAVALVLAACAVWTRAGLWSEIQEIRAAFEAAAAERDRLCTTAPDRCRPRLRLAVDKSPDDPGAWSYEIAPSYRTEFDMGLERLRPALKRTWLGLEYWHQVTGALAGRADAGEVAERDAWLVTRKATEQSRRMMIEQVNHAADSPEDPEAWRAAAFRLLSHAVDDLNASTAASTGIGSSAAAIAAPVVTGARCTAPVVALGGRRLCPMTDGSVTSR